MSPQPIKADKYGFGGRLLDASVMVVRGYAELIVARYLTIVGADASAYFPFGASAGSSREMQTSSSSLRA